MFSWDLLANAVVAGVLLGGFYAAVSLGVSSPSGSWTCQYRPPCLRDPRIVCAYAMNSSFGLDPILAGCS